jgi:glutamate-1-semialdehyde 2,1-aminomutase
MKAIKNRLMKTKNNCMGKGQDLYNKAKKFIPGGTQLLSKRPEMFLPDQWPAYYEKSEGCEVWDLDGNKYIDASYMGIGACVLGYAHPVVNKSVTDCIAKGSMNTLNAPEEVELAELMCKLHPWAGMVRYTRSGGEAMMVAVRIARAKTKKDKVLFCGYHGWHDWYLAANLADNSALDGHLLPGLSPTGVPRHLKESAFPFNYNKVNEFISHLEKHGNNIAAVVMESIRNDYPEAEFIKTIREKTKELEIVLILDEITAGWRLNGGGAHLLFNIDPDIAVFGKAISNGFPMGVIIGRSEIMQAAQDSFISSTYWTERIGPVASISTIKFFIENKVHEHLINVGKKVQRGWTEMAKKHQLDIDVGGIFPLSHFSFNHPEPLVLKTLYTQNMLEQGFLATTGLYSSYAHKDEHIQKYLKAGDAAFELISNAIKSGNPQKYLKGPVCHSGFKRLN